MWIWKKITGFKKEKEIILNAFPISLREDVKKMISILPFSNYVLFHHGEIISEQILKVDNLINSELEMIVFNDEILNIPTRIYFNEPTCKKENELTDLQKVILNCFYLRHHNGYIRQKRLEQLIDKSELFIVAFTFPLLGSYVVEILEVLKRHVSANVFNYADFVKQNEKYFIKTESRVISYWDAYHRQKYPKLKAYIGQQNVDIIKAAIKK